MRIFWIAAAALSLSACNLVFKLPTRQGNVIEQKQLDQLKVGMTPQQVTYLLGTPIATSPFRSDRWTYTGYYKSPRGQLSTRTVTLYFENNVLSRMDGIAAPNGTQPESPEAEDAAGKSVKPAAAATEPAAVVPPVTPETPASQKP